MKHRILYITPEIPHFPGGHGGNIREFNLLSRLAGRFQFDMIALKPSDRINVEQVNQLGVEVLYYPPADNPMKPKAVWRKKLQQLLRFGGMAFSSLRRGASDNLPPLSAYYLQVFRNASIRLNLQVYDLIQIEHTYLLPIADLLSKSANCPPIVVTAHNIEAIQADRTAMLCRGINRLFEKMIARLTRRMEENLITKASMVLTMSKHDAQWIVENYGMPHDSVAIVPNGVDTDYFLEIKSEPEQDLLVFTGTFGHFPNLDAVMWFRRYILPRIVQECPGARFLAAGSTRLASKLVHTLREGPNESYEFNVADIRPYIQRAAIYVVPLRAGSGTRLKILEAMACGCAVVSTRIGAEGLDVPDGEAILLADSAEDFVRSLSFLLKNPDIAHRLGAKARQWVNQNCNWTGIAEQQLNLYHRILAKKGKFPGEIETINGRPGCVFGNNSA